MVAETAFVTLEGSANALAINKDASQVVVAGRNVFKIFSVEPDKLVDRLNLRVGKNLSLNFSCADVAWNPVDDAMLATAATNGCVVTWNLNKTSHSKQGMLATLKSLQIYLECDADIGVILLSYQVFQDHNRTVNKVCFHTTEAHLLLSGSQDGTMKLFDVRKKEAVSTFYSLSESVRDVHFCPHQYFIFAAVQENGNVQLWDLRRTDRFERQFTAHSGPVFTCDWHPEEKRWLATAGRDKAIKVWDVSLEPHLEHCIQTIASVARVRWRPQRKYNIASSSLVVDFTVNVWDVRRPYVPFASFNEHKDVTTGFSWRNDPHVLLTTSKDCTLYQHSFKDATRPADHANPVGLNINPFGNICFAVSDKIIGDNNPNARGSNLTSGRFPAFFKRTRTLSDQFRSASSTMMILYNSHKDLSMDWFIQSAKEYKLTGKPIPDLCEHNSSIALKLHRLQVSQTWLILKLLYMPGSSLISEYSNNVSDSKLPGDDKSLENSQESATLLINGNSCKGSSRHVSGERLTTDMSGCTEDDSDSVNTEHESTITNIAGDLGQGDFFFGDGELEIPKVYDYPSNLAAGEDWALPREAFNLRHPLGDGSPPAEFTTMEQCSYSYQDEIQKDLAITELEDQTRRLATSSVPTYPSWNFSHIVMDMLQFYADKSDLQMAVSVLLVLGSKARELIDITIQENWFLSYIELLSRFQLWNVANEVTKLSRLPAVSSLNQQSTTIKTICGNCKKHLSTAGWYCHNCKAMVSICSVCHETVKGTFVWCQGCAHGGHLRHIQDWFKNYRECPTGCGHACEFT